MKSQDGNWVSDNKEKTAGGGEQAAKGRDVKRILTARVLALLALSVSIWVFIAIALGGVIYRRGVSGTPSTAGTATDSDAGGAGEFEPGYFALYIIGGAIDLDGDGADDGFVVDMDGDGIADGVDFDGDALADPFDLDLDGVADGLDFDLDGDGVYDTYSFMVEWRATPSEAAGGSGGEEGPGTGGGGYVDSGPGAAGGGEDGSGSAGGDGTATPTEALPDTGDGAPEGTETGGAETGPGILAETTAEPDLGGVLGALGGGLLGGGGLIPAATPAFALFGAHLPHVGGSEVWVYAWKHTPQFDDDGIPPLDDYDWDANAGEVPDADPDDPDTCPGLYEVLTHSEYDGYTVYLMADIVIPGGTTAAAGVEVAAGITSITIDGVWPAVDPDDYDGDGVDDEVDDDLDGDGIPNATYDGDGLILSLDMQLAGAHTLSQETNMSVFGSGYDALYGNTTGRFFTIRVTHQMDFFRLRNMDAYARVAEGMVWVQPGLTCEGTMLEYSNVNFTGPQMVYNIDGGASFRNVNIMMDGPDIGRTGDTHGGFGCKQEVAQLCTADFYGYFNVHHDTDDTTHYYHVFFFYPDTDIYSGDPAAGNGGLYYMRFHENANVHVVSDNMSLTWFDTNRAGAGHTNGYIDYSNLDMYLEEGAQFWYTGYSGFTRKAFDSEIDQFEMEPGSRMDVHILGTPNADEYPGFPLTGTAHIREGAHLTFRNDVSIYPDGDWALVGDETEGYGRGNWDIDGGVVRFTQSGDITNSYTVARHFIRQKGFSVTNGGIFEVKQVNGSFGLTAPCVVLGTDGLYVDGEGSAFECVMRNSRITSEGIRSYGPIYVGPGANFSYEIRDDADNPYTPAIRSLLRMVGGSGGAGPAILVDDPQSFMLAATTGRLIEYPDYPGPLDIAGEQVNYWTALPSVPTPPVFPDRPTAHYMNDVTDLVNPAQPQLGRVPVRLAGTMATGVGSANGWTISTVYYTGTDPAAVNTSVFATAFNTVRAISAGRMHLDTDVYFADAGMELTGETLAGASVHVIKDPYDPATDNYNATPHQFLADDETGEFAARIDDVHGGDVFWVLASKNYLFAEVWQVAQYSAFPKVVYVDGTLTDPLTDGSDPDGPGRGGTPSKPVRTLLRAAEILALSGGDVIYVVGKVSGVNGSISGIGATVAVNDHGVTRTLKGPYDQLAGTYGGISTLEIRRFVTPTAGFATIGGSPNPDYDEEYDVPDYTGALIEVTGAGDSFYVDHVVIDGSHEERAGVYYAHTTYMVDENGDVVLDDYNDPVVAATYEIPMACTEVDGRNPKALDTMVRTYGAFTAGPPAVIRNNYNDNTSGSAAEAGAVHVMSGAVFQALQPGSGSAYVEIYGNTFTGIWDGGVVMGEPNSYMNLYHADIHHNVSRGNGGAVRVYNATLNIDYGTLIHHNSTTQSNGGGVYGYNSSIYVADSKFYSNTAAIQGGAIAISLGTLNLAANASGGYAEIYGNSVPYGGAGILSNQGTVNIGMAEIHHNTAGDGAAMHMYYATLNVTDAKIHDNTSTQAGAIYADGTNTITISGGDYYNNAATGSLGGFMFAAAGPTTINGGKFHDNTALSAGGAIYINGGGALVSIAGGEYYNNYAQNSGGAFVLSGTATMSGGEIHHNTISTSGGGGGAIMLNVGTTLTMTGGDIHHNSAATAPVYSNGGGAVFVTPTSSFAMSGGSLRENAGWRGGAVHVQATGTFTYIDGAITGNTSPNPLGGKGVFVIGDCVLDCQNPTAPGRIGTDQDFLLDANQSGGVWTDSYITAKRKLTGGALKINVTHAFQGRTVIDYDDSIPGILVSGTSDQPPYYVLGLPDATAFYQLRERAADISVLELEEIFPAYPVVYVDGTLPAVLGDGSDPDGAGRGGFPSAPVRTLKRAFELLREAEPYIVPIPSGGITDPDNAIEVDGGGAALEADYQWANLIYIVGKVTVDQDTEIDTVVDGGGVTHVYYSDAGMVAASEAPIELAAPDIRIRRFVTPLVGDYTQADYDARFGVNTYRGDLFQVGVNPYSMWTTPSAAVTLRLGRGVDVDGHYAAMTSATATATNRNGIYWKMGWKRTGVTQVTRAQGTMFDVRDDGKFIMGLDIATNPGAYSVPDGDSVRLHHNFVDIVVDNTVISWGGAVRNGGIFHMNSGIIECNYLGGDANYRSTYNGWGGGIAVIYNGEASLNGIIRYNMGGGGGGVYQNAPMVSCDDSGLLIDGNYAFDIGGGIFASSGNTAQLLLTKGTITNNTAYRYGGGICIATNLTMDIGGGGSMVTIRGNKATRGGGIFVWEGTANLREVELRDNIAEHGAGVVQGLALGGGIYNTSTVNFYSGLVDNCVTRRQTGVDGAGLPIYDHAGFGGGIANGTGGTLNIYGTVAITACKATAGGGIFLMGGTVNLTSGAAPTISGNVATKMTAAVPSGLPAGGYETYDGDGGGVCVHDGTFNMYGGTLLMNEAKGKGGGVFIGYSNSAAALVNLVGGSVANNAADTRGGGLCMEIAHFQSGGGSWYSVWGAAQITTTTFSGNTVTAPYGMGNGVFDCGRLTLKAATHGFAANQQIYLYNDVYINRDYYDTTGNLLIGMGDFYAGRDVIVYDPAVVVAPGCDPQHTQYVLDNANWDWLFLVQDAGASNVLELQMWPVFDVTITDEYFLIMKNELSGNEPFAVPVGGTTSDDSALVAEADTNLVSPKFKIRNGGAWPVQVQVIGFLNKNTEALVNTALFPDINLVSSSTAALLPTAADNDLYLAVKGTSSAGNAFSALAATSLHDLGTLGANTITMGTIPAPTAPVPNPFGEFEFVAAAGNGFMEKYKDPAFPLGAAATAKKDHIRTVVPYMPNRAVNGRAKWQIYFRFVRGN